VAAANFVVRALAPHLSFFIAQCDRGPPTIVGLGAPDQGAGSSPIGRWAY
jgi:hypothetical protein